MQGARYMRNWKNIKRFVWGWEQENVEYGGKIKTKEILYKRKKTRGSSESNLLKKGEREFYGGQAVKPIARF